MMKHDIAKLWKIVPGIIFLFLLSCSGKSEKSEERETTPGDTLTFQLPEIPTMLSEVSDRMNYLVLHYWDLFAFRDTNYIHAADVTEQALVNYLDLSARVEPAVMEQSFDRLLQQAAAEPVTLNYFLENVRRYLYDPNSPMRNEEFYTHWANVLLRSDAVNLHYQMQAQHDLKMIAINRPGEPANDFAYTLRNGAKSRLSKLQSPLTLLLFYNPDCDRCQAVISAMKQSYVLDDAIRTGQVTLLALYADGDKEVWQQSEGEIPAAWIDAADLQQTILLNDLYDLTALPSLYLLDDAKNVLLKDANFSQVEKFFE